jgi:uncharacterized protein YeaO (DUF488 family)
VTPKIRLHRVYDHTSTPPGARVLVDRLWPRGIRKDDLKLTLWARDVAPSDELRKWFGHRVERWPEFQVRYRAELRQPQASAQLAELVQLARKGPLTLLYGAKDEQHNEAVVLRSVLERRLA